MGDLARDGTAFRAHETPAPLEGGGRYQNRFRIAPDDDIDLDGHADPELCGLGQRDPDTVAALHRVAHRRDLGDGAFRRFAREGIGADQDRLPCAHSRDVVLVHVGGDAQGRGLADPKECATFAHHLARFAIAA